MKRLFVGLAALFFIFILPHLYAQSPGAGVQAQGGGGCGNNSTFLGNSKSEDSDNDGIPNSEDNCPYEYNPHQTDVEGQAGVGDLCEKLNPNNCQECSAGNECPADKPVCIEGCCESGGACGDNLWEPEQGEECEYLSVDGSPPSPVGCNNCDPSTCLCEEEVGLPVCGNLILEQDEVCDFVMVDRVVQAQGLCDFNSGETCNPNYCFCEPPQNGAVCGDFILDEGEACEIVMTRGGPQPVGNCDFAAGESCVDCNCVPVLCGDGAITGNETCDFISGPRGSTPILQNCLEGQSCDAQTCQCTGGNLDTCGDGAVTGAEGCDFSLDSGAPVPILTNCQVGDSCGEPSTPQQCQCIPPGQIFCDESGCPGFCDTAENITFCNDFNCGGPSINCQSDPSVCDAFEPIFQLLMQCDGNCCIPER